MGKGKANGGYNDFIDGEKLRDNAEVRTSLQGGSNPRPVSPPPVRQNHNAQGKGTRKGGPKKPPLTHFLCLPLVTESSRPSLEQGLQKLKQDVSATYLVPPKAVRPVGSLHLTLGVMSLNQESLLAAERYLRALDLHILLRDISHRKIAEQAAEDGTIAENLNAAAMPDTDALAVNLESLVPMHAPHRTSILYAEPKDTSGRLLPFATALKEHFTQQGHLVDDTRPLKLHATLVNTVYAKRGARAGKAAMQTGTSDPSGGPSDDPLPPSDSTTRDAAAGHGPDAKSWMHFDATGLLERYKGHAWAQNVRIDRVQICKMGASKVLDERGEVLDERYEVVCEKGIFE